ncbi:amino acid ABC transporter permease [Thermophilibacter immobilis]|uniref:Amino acid ABC transporter permease n=1 Tax=Thermophilibacter immobilis TaxID=2779519 RepID=A0A7S7M741_9ACTN|nr:amino acid ABC transporter permease [Thermophilibacter immobilis]QOY59930.1 amino acid ABC transporter permease [Thermophilibacter immobilis]
MSTRAPAADSMRDALYEAPGPRTRRTIRIGTALSALVVLVGLAAVVRQFYVTGQLAPQYWSFFLASTTWSFLLKGFVGTVEVAFTAGLIALALGLLLMLGRTSSWRPLSAVCRVVIDFFRGVPSLLLIYFFFLVVPQYGIKISSFWMLTLPVALAASGVLAEVFRAGVNAVPTGQVEAALSLGLSPAKTMLRIVLPQAVRYVIPSLISQLVVVVKDTTVAYVVSYPDLMQNARVLITRYDSLVSMYLVVAVIYILINYVINKVSVYVSRRTGVKIIR